MDREIKHAETPFGEIAFEDRGDGPPALFVHGVFLNGYLWRHVVDRVADLRRCIALDLLAHGATRTADGADLSFGAQAEMLDAFCDALAIDQVDLVGNDSGGGIAQIFAARHPERIRSLTLTNCDVHDRWPPETFEPTIEAVANGRLKELVDGMLTALETARGALSVGYEHAERLSEETIRTYLEPFNSEPAIRQLERFFASMDSAQTVAVEDALRRFQAPTLIVWGTGDIFFDLESAYWLRDTIPGVRKLIELPGAKLFFPEERPDDLTPPLREHWEAAALTDAGDRELTAG
jgi:pimeloyl-ACP methyl ester carboxylesterase